MLSIKNWPNDEQPREKLITYGAENLSSAELLAIFLRTGMKGKTALDLARDLLNHFGGLRNLLGANVNEFCKMPGLGQAKFAQLQAVLELNRRYLYETLKDVDILKNPRHTREYLLSRMGHLTREIFACLFLTSQYKVIAFIELFQGSINQTDVYLGQVVKAALKYDAAAIIVAHNHPSGDPEPSQADIELTRELQKALNLVEIQLLDHIILGSNQSVSFAEKGLMP